MNSTDRVSSIFREPWQFGLRGDPFLWNELREHFVAAGIPETQEEFVAQVTATIKELTGSGLRSDTPVFVERYDAGGMSSGYISPQWWRTKGIPLLTQQFASGPVNSRADDILE